ncbi:MAG TPA: sugar phosphate isomerase/epimerase family protein [Acidobacteriota bacterium]|nr:sugar phosphate isomerase/epimerase family protein [Acidobacteriota bacterium]
MGPFKRFSRREFVERGLFIPTAAMFGAGLTLAEGAAPGRIERPEGSNIKLSLNAYSFNRPLRQGEMTLDELLALSAELNFAAVDLTGYYFPGYPEPPDDVFLNEIKRTAYYYGLAISGTGIRNNFADPSEANRRKDIAHIRKWVEVAARMGAPTLRVFAGGELPEGYTRAEATNWVVESLAECVEFGKEHGIVLTLQNHANFLKTPDHVLEILERVDSDWLALNLDIGSFRSQDPFAEIERMAPYAVTWQIKEQMYFGDKPTTTDLARIVEIIRNAGFRGYILVETLGEGDPKIKVPRFLDAVRAALAA